MTAGMNVMPSLLRPAARTWVVRVAVIIVVTALEALAQGPLWFSHPALPIVNLATLVTFLITGTLLIEERGQRGTAWALILAGITRPLGWLNDWGIGPLPLYASVFGYLDDIFGAWALLRYPNYRLEGCQRRFLAAMSIWLVGGPAVLAMVSRPAWHQFPASSWWPSWWPNLDAYEVGLHVVDVGALALAGLFIALLMQRFLRAKGVDRLILTPVVVAAIVAAIAAGTVVAGLLFSSGNDNLFTIEGAAELAVPLAFLISVIQRSTARGGVAELAAQLSGPDPAGAVRQALRQVLHDPGLEVLCWVPEDELYVDSGGRQADPGLPPDGKIVMKMTASDGRTPLAVIFADRSVTRDPVLLEGTLAASRMALENARLQADLQFQLDEVKASSARIVEAGLAERRRLERNLHDGAQQRLLGLAATLQAIRATSADPAVLTAMDDAGAQLRETLSELRDLARGILPPSLSQSGISAALEGVAERLQFPVRLDVTKHRFSPAIEGTAYFVVCEALANIFKHAHASRADVQIKAEKQALVIEVQDDGTGGADPQGSGLAALKDRVSPLGGEITIASPPGGGTRMTARIPCV